MSSLEVLQQNPLMSHISNSAPQSLSALFLVSVSMEISVTDTPKNIVNEFRNQKFHLGSPSCPRPHVAGAWTKRKKMFHGGSFLKLADDNKYIKNPEAQNPEEAF